MSSNLDLLESISADMALETPQTLLQWEFKDSVPDIDYIRIRRSTYRYPEDTSEGDAVLDEAFDPDNPRVSFADLTPQADLVHYYSVFFEHKGPWSVDLVSQYDTERLGQARSVVQQSTLGSVDAVAIAGRDLLGQEVIWTYDIVKEMCVRKRIATGILDSDEIISSVVVNFIFATESILIVTNKRTIFLDITTAEAAEPELELLPSHVLFSFDLEGILSPGYVVSGAAPAAAFPDIYILDSENEEIVVVDVTTGVVSSTTDISGLNLLGELSGLGVDGASFVLGAGKVLYKISLSPPINNFDIQNAYPIRQDLVGDFSLDAGNDRLYVIDDVLGQLQIYDTTYDDSLLNIQVEEPAVAAPTSCRVLCRFEETGSTAFDSSPNGTDGTLNGSAEQGVSDGRFGKAIQFTTISDYVTFGVPIGWNGTVGTVAFWYREPYAGYVPPANDRILFESFTDFSNFSFIILDKDNELRASFLRAGSAGALTWPIPAGAFSRFRHIQYTYTATDHYLYVDGVLVDSGALGGTWIVADPAPVLGGDSLGSSALGFFDELQLHSASRTPFTRYALTTVGNRCHALAGRDPDSLAINFRDQLKTYFDDFILRNDYLPAKLPQDTEVSENGQVVFRQDPDELVLGHLGRTARLFGLFLDRNIDRRRFFMNHLTASAVEDEFISALGQVINVEDFDEDWNVDQRRRFLEVMFYCYHRGGSLDSFIRMARFLGFRLHDPPGGLETIFSRYRLDSVSDPLRPDVPFDTGVFDTTDDAYPLTRLLLRFFKQNFESTTGSTSVPATRRLTDGSASFLDDAEEGSMIFVHDVDDTGDNGQYIITNIVSSFVVEVDRDWPVGSLSNLTYRLYWRVPNPDPYVDSILTRFSKFKARWQRLEKDPS